MYYVSGVFPLLDEPIDRNGSRLDPCPFNWLAT